MENFNEFIQEAIAGIKRNPHKYPSFCRGMVDKLDRLTVERDRYKTALERIANMEPWVAQYSDWNMAARTALEYKGGGRMNKYEIYLFNGNRTVPLNASRFMVEGEFVVFLVDDEAVACFHNATSIIKMEAK